MPDIYYSYFIKLGINLYSRLGKDFYVQIKVLGQGDWTADMTRVESQSFQDVREKIYDCVSFWIFFILSLQFTNKLRIHF